MTTLTLNGLRKSYGAAEVIKGVDLQIADGEFVVFVGPSGCGKSTLLRMIAGLEEITGGDLTIGGTLMNDVPPAKRGVAMVFQSYALYPHLTVRENIGFGLKVRKLRPPEIAAKVAEAAGSLQLDALLDRYPRELSGGQRQRVAIGRAIVSDPDVFLFDEPLSNLDAELRVHMRGEIAELHGRLKNTMIYVTHDQVEAMTLADKIVVLRDGQIEQVGTPKDLYEQPANIFVAQFIGSPKMNILPFDRTALPTRLFPVEGEHRPDMPAAPAHFGIRPEHIEAVPVGEGDVDVTVIMSEYLGADRFLRVATTEGVEFMVRASGKSDVTTGDKIGLSYDPGSIHFFDAQGYRVVP